MQDPTRAVNRGVSNVNESDRMLYMSDFGMTRLAMSAKLAKALSPKQHLNVVRLRVVVLGLRSKAVKVYTKDVGSFSTSLPTEEQSWWCLLSDRTCSAGHHIKSLKHSRDLEDSRKRQPL